LHFIICTRPVRPTAVSALSVFARVLPAQRFFVSPHPPYTLFPRRPTDSADRTPRRVAAAADEIRCRPGHIIIIRRWTSLGTA
jgi:hypothetical protein